MSQAAKGLHELQGLLTKLGSDGWQARQLAAEELIDGLSAMDEGTRDALIDRLIEEVVAPTNIGARAAAQEVLTHLGRAVVPKVLTRVKAQGPGARLLIDLLAYLGQDEDVSALEEILASARDDQNLRAAVGSVLGAIGTPAACQVLVQLLEDESPHLRVFALDGLRLADYALSREHLRALSEDTLTRKAAVALYGGCQDAQAVHDLAHFLCDSVRGVRTAALMSLGHLLDWASEHASDAARELIGQVLSELGEPGREQLVKLATQGDREVLCRALEVAQHCVHVDVLGVAVDHMDDGCVYERSMTLATICGESTLDFFQPWLDDPTKSAVLEPVYRLVAMSGVHDLDVEWSEHLLMQVQSGQAELVSSACDALGKCGPAWVMKSLLEFCKEDSYLGEHAADALSSLLTRHNECLASLFAPYGGDPQAWCDPSQGGPLARNICRIVGRTGDLQAHVLLEQALSSADIEARIAAIVALGRVPSQPRSESLLRLALADEDPQARAAACRSLARLGLCRAAAGLLSATEDTSAFVRAAAVQSLVQLDCDAARERLLAMIEQQDSPSVLVYAIEGLGRWAAPEDQASLIKLTAHEDVEIVKAALRALDAYPDASVTSRALSLLEHERWDVRWVAAESLKERAEPKLCEQLRSAVQAEDDPLVQETLELCLERAEGVGQRL